MSPTIYERVPGELKLMIWEEAVPTSGFHYFKVEVPKSDAQDQRLGVVPMGLASDTSTWIERWNLHETSVAARHVVRRWIRETKEEEKALWIAPFPQKRGQSQQQRDRAMVHAKNDIVCLQFAGKHDFDIAFLDIARTKERFQGLQKIAINLRAPESGRGWVVRPFQCLCSIGRHNRNFWHCPVALSQFLSLFPSLKCFYFVYRINGTQIKSPSGLNLAKTGQKRTRQGKPPKKSADQVINETLAKFRGIAKRNNREIIMDTKRTYYEVDLNDSKMLVHNKELWHMVTHLEYEINRRAPRSATTQVKVLVCRDRFQQDA